MLLKQEVSSFSKSVFWVFFWYRKIKNLLSILPYSINHLYLVYSLYTGIKSGCKDVITLFFCIFVPTLSLAPLKNNASVYIF